MNRYDQPLPFSAVSRAVRISYRVLIALLLLGASSAPAAQVAVAPTPEIAVTPAVSASPFTTHQAPGSSTIEYPGEGVSVQFQPAAGQFLISGPGLQALRKACLYFRSDGKNYRFPGGIRLLNSEVTEGANTVGRFIELSAAWIARTPKGTHIRTALRLYEGLQGVVFEQSYPDGAASIGSRGFADVGCAFPVFDPGPDAPADLQWLSYTYQDWPIPIRGAGWPERLGAAGWPAPGSDDGIRAPLALFDKGGHCEVLSPLDHGLQQITALSAPTLGDEPPPPSLMVGVEGRLQALPPGAAFHSVLSLGQTGVVNAVLDWGRFLQRYNGKAAWKTPDDLTAHTLGYWTDNGSAYYSHGAGNANYQAILAAVHAYHTENHIPVRYYQLDSWWYPKGVDGGTSTWEPNQVNIPDGTAAIGRVLGVPVALHNRYWSSQSPYLAGGQFSTKVGAGVPVGKDFYDDLFRTVTGWGCRLYEQDWLAYQFRRVDDLQTRYGLADEWLNGMDDAAAHWSLPIQFCMPSIGFYLASSGMPNVTQIRSSQDFSRDTWDNVRKRWMEHGQLSLLAAALGMAPSKDVLLTTRPGGLEAGSWEQAEALMAILSTGPVGIGDAFGYTDAGLVNRLSLEDGTLVQPDRPALPVEDSVTGAADAAGRPMALQTLSTVDGLTWRYLLTLDLRASPVYSFQSLPEVIPTTRSLGALDGRYLAYDYLHDRSLGIAGDGATALSTGPTTATYTILAPIQADGSAIIGDISKFVTASHTRFSSIRIVRGVYELGLQGPANSVVRLVVFDPNGQPTLNVNGAPVFSEVAKTHLALLPKVGPGPSRADGGLPTLTPATGQADSLWYFSFHLPSTAGGAPVKAVLKTAYDMGIPRVVNLPTDAQRHTEKPKE